MQSNSMDLIFEQINYHKQQEDAITSKAKKV